MQREETKRALIVVRTYPVPAKTGAEVSCTAAITKNGEWLRLFPVPWRLLSEEQQFRKYQWVDFRVVKASDARPESYKLKQDGINITSDPLSTNKAWKARKDVVFPLRAHCLCCLAKQRDEKGYPTLGVFRPKSIDRLIITAEDPNWTQGQLETLRQGHLFLERPPTDLEKIPFLFRYEFRCDHDTCTGHKLMCTDWEIGQSYRKWRDQYGDGWVAKFRQRFEHDMMNTKDTHFFVGTIHQHPKAWIIVGLFYPPRAPEDSQPKLF